MHANFCVNLQYRFQAFLRAIPPEPGLGIRLALWQGPGQAGSEAAVLENLVRLEALCGIAAAQDVQILVFPELYLSGYLLTPVAVSSLAESVEGPSLTRVAAAARRHGLAVCCPYPERAIVGGVERFYDAIALFGADGSLLRNYRKTHLWGPDEKRCWSPGYLHAEEGPVWTVQRVHPRQREGVLPGQQHYLRSPRGCTLCSQVGAMPPRCRLPPGRVRPDPSAGD